MYIRMRLESILKHSTTLESLLQIAEFIIKPITGVYENKDL